MPTLLESMLTAGSLDKTVYEPTGVGYSGLPIEAGITPCSPKWGRWCGAGSEVGGPASTPSMLTVKVWSEMLATPTTAGPVLISVDTPPTVSAIVLCDGQYLSGTHWTTSLSSQSNLPVIAGVALTSTERSAARRLAESVTGAVNFTITGCATPTTSSRVGRIDAIANPCGWLDAARLTSAGVTTTLAAAPNTARTHRTPVRMAPIPFD